MCRTSPEGQASQPTQPTAFGWAPRPALFVSALVSVAMLAQVAIGDVIAPSTPVAIRAAVVCLGATLVPGIPIVIALRIPGRALSASLTVALSMATTILASQFTIVVHWWNPERTQALLGTLGLALCAAAWLTLPSRCTLSRNRFQSLRWVDRSRGTALAGLAAASVLFAVQTSTLDYMASSRFGIISEIGWPFVAGFLVLSGVIAVTLTRSRIDHVVMAAATVVMIAYTTLLVPISTGMTTIPASFVHRGFIALLAQTGELPSALDARFSWAGFFSAGAHMTVVSSLHDSMPFMALAPLYFNGLLAFPLYAIAIAVTGRTRVAWMAVLLYQLFNWYQQDYYAPQSVALMFYTTIVATLLWQLRRAPLPRLRPGLVGALVSAPRRTLGRVRGFGSGRTTAISGALTILIMAMVVTHQITPLLTIVSLGAFSLLGVTRYRTLWLVAALVFAAWFSYGAADYWMGHLREILGDFGRVGSAVDQGVGDRLRGDPVYKSMQYLRIGASTAFVLMAFAGWLTLYRHRSWLISGFLCGAPFSLIALQSYGGEVIIRSFLLSSPFLAPASAFGISRGLAWVRIRLSGSYTRERHWPAIVAAAVATTALGMLLTTNRGLNTAFEATTPEEVAVTDQFIAEVPSDRSIMSWNFSPQPVGARRSLDTATPKMIFVQDDYTCLNDLAACALERAPSFIYISSQGVGILRYQYGMSYDDLGRVISTIVESGDYVPILIQPNVAILRRTDTPKIGMEGQ